MKQLNKQRRTFTTPFNQYKEYVGKPFKLIGEVDPNMLDEEVGSMYWIEFEDGIQIMAFPDEIFV